jgi:DNA-binding NarL/FixJ family response regulator
MILALSPELFTEKDVVILRKIQKGVKYEVIANEENMALSTLKKHARRMFDNLRVNDRVDFLSMYANHQICIEKKYTE